MFLLGILCFLATGYGLVPYFMLKNLQIYPILTKPIWGKKNAIILLGAGTVRMPISQLSMPGSMAYARIHQATRLYYSCKKTGNLCVIITSGDDVTRRGLGKNIYRNELLALGVNNNDIIAESRSINTYQNAKFTSTILKPMKFDQIYLVTSSLHMRRSLLSFSYFGINAIPAPADYLRAQFTYIPRGYNFAASDAAAHEWAGIWKLAVFDDMKWKQ